MRLGLFLLVLRPPGMDEALARFETALGALVGGRIEVAPILPVPAPGVPSRPAPPQAGRWGRVVPGGTGVWYSGGTHGGYPAADIYAPMGSRINAPHGGVLTAFPTPLGGNSAILEGVNGRWYYFAHAREQMGSGRVQRGVVIGYVGDSGNARGGPPHLHFAVASRQEIFAQRNGSGDLTEDMSE